MRARRQPDHRYAGHWVRPGVLGLAVLLVAGIMVALSASSHPASATHGTSSGKAGSAGSAGTARAASAGPDWVTTWGGSPQPAAPGTLAATGFDDQTVRDIVSTSVGGDAIRLELSNAFGTKALDVGRVTVAVAGPGAAVRPGTINPVTFSGGQTSVVIPAGRQVLSDPVDMAVGPLQDLTVSIYLPGRTGQATYHWDAQQVNWIAAGDHTGDTLGDAYRLQSDSWYYLSGLVVQTSAADGTVVTLGDSITDGWHSTLDANARWPNDLARRLDALSGPTLSIDDEGISGNRLLAYSIRFGTSALSRFTQDVLDQPGVRDVIVLEGINDIGFSGGAVRASAIIAGYEQLIAEAHARGLKIFGATLLPYQGSGYYTTRGEAVREAVNTWIRTSHAFDGVIDFDAVMRDPADPLRLDPRYDSGDDLHPNDLGYQVMADAINLAMLTLAAG